MQAENRELCWKTANRPSPPSLSYHVQHGGRSDRSQSSFGNTLWLIFAFSVSTNTTLAIAEISSPATINAAALFAMERTWVEGDVPM
jgi:hypothetical protein